MDPKALSSVASALAVESRAAVVAALMGGTAHTGRELADHVGVSPSTVSEHLGILVDAGLVSVEAQGRHRYFRLAGADVASAVETLGLLDAGVEPARTPRLRSGLRFARSCYDHLAGELGVEVHDRLVDVGAVAWSDGGPSVTAAGRVLLAGLGIDLAVDGAASGNGRRPLVRVCLDWSQRRHHLGGVVGARLLWLMLDRRWLSRHPQRPRELRLTTAGRQALATDLGIEIP